MSTFLIFVMALIICVTLVTWGCAMVVLRLAPIWVRLTRRQTQYQSLINEMVKIRWTATQHEEKLKEFEIKIARLNDEQVNEVLARTGRR